MATKEWEQLSKTEKSKDEIRMITDEIADNLLKVIVQDSAFEFKESVNMYVQTERKLRNTEKKLRLSLAPYEDLQTQFENFLIALENKQTAVRNIKNEHIFLCGGGTVRPPIDGKYVMRELIKHVMKDMTDEDYQEVIDIIKISREER